MHPPELSSTPGSSPVKKRCVGVAANQAFANWIIGCLYTVLRTV